MKKDKSLDCYKKSKNKEFTAKSQKHNIIKIINKIHF